MMNLEPILAEVLDASTKGYPLSGAADCRFPRSAHRRWSVLGGDLPLPLAVIRDSALAHNHAWMRDFTASTGVLLAPHGKTTMAPQIFAQQLAAGAWGITVANVQQLGICVRFGVRRVIMANQLLGAAEVATVIRLLDVASGSRIPFPDRFACATCRDRSRRGSAYDVAQAHRAGGTGCAGRTHRLPNVRRGDGRGACGRGEQVRRAVGARMLRRPAGQRRFGAGHGHGGRVDAPDQGSRACLRRAKTCSQARRSFSPRAARRRSTSSRANCRCICRSRC